MCCTKRGEKKSNLHIFASKLFCIVGCHCVEKFLIVHMKNFMHLIYSYHEQKKYIKIYERSEMKKKCFASCTCMLVQQMV